MEAQGFLEVHHLQSNPVLGLCSQMGLLEKAEGGEMEEQHLLF